ncbi:MAG: FAD-binding oxidoreductase [Tolumonas sp.]|nr:FAD-binding oxidoreductase [Tolumonas sp.]
MNYKISLMPSEISFDADQELTILQSALKNDVVLEHSCGNGQCGACKTKLINGRISFEDKFNILTENDKSEKIFLSCVTKPLSDISIRADFYPELLDVKTKTVPCKVHSIEYPVESVAVLKLRLPPSADFNFLPGQYIDLTYNGVSRSYSIASAIVENNLLELHIRKVTDGVFSGFVFNEFKPNQLLRMQGPIGTFFIRKTDKPLIFVAGGTGFAPVKAMVESLIKQDDKRAIHIYWGARKQDDIYSDLPNQWANQYPNIISQVIVSDDNTWDGRCGFVHQAVLDDFENLNGFMVYACGASAMINIARRTFIEKGLDEHSFIADAFLPATAIA